MSSVYENEEDRQLARILSMLIWASWGVYLFVILSGLYFNDWAVISVTLTGCVSLVIPLILLRQRNLRASSLIVTLIVLATITIIATVGQGIRDLAIVALPIVIIFAGLTLPQSLFRLSVGLTLAAVCWLVFGEANGWFTTKPFAGEMTNWFYLIGTSLILLVAALSVELLATNMRRSLGQARSEIAQRTHIEGQLRFQGTHDALTNIYNRAFFMDELNRLEHSRDFPISVIMADVDKLKAVNDIQGHARGDELLRHTAKILHSVFRERDVLARIGGDEFAVLLPTTNEAIAEQMLVRVKDQIARHNAEHPDLPVELSLGASTAENNNLAEVFTVADRRMYADKAERRSRQII
ncbi:MAG: GGDEF domain-containing protein [Chloroflexi bacterium]|nr:GGDEF domain-containing protein [Chloroflexota bacterium]